MINLTLERFSAAAALHGKGFRVGKNVPCAGEKSSFLRLLLIIFRSWFDTSPRTENNLSYWSCIRSCQGIAACPELVEGGRTGLFTAASNFL
jgi:hypothetical protein